MPKNTNNRQIPSRERIAIWGAIGLIGAALITVLGNIVITNAQSPPIPTLGSTATPIPTTLTFTFTPSPTPTETPIPDTPTQTPAPWNQFNVSVPANEYWFNTGIVVKQGQELEFVVQAQDDKWGSGIRITGPDGDSSHYCDQRYIICDNLGVLVGAIGAPNSDWETLNPVAFKIGSASIHAVKEDGVLFLSMNENIGDCKGDSPGSCFEDNFFSLEVTITVK